MAHARTAQFRRLVWNFFRAHGRELPWRKHRTPYRVVVSEVMLQQTQVSRVIPYFHRWMNAFPTFKKLAAASTIEVLRVWQGLGYNRRAVSLKKLAGVVVGEYGGKLPDDAERLLALPGIGRYTAGAVLAFAFNRAVPFVDTNIRRVYIHHFFPKRTKVRDREVLAKVSATIDRRRPGEWYSALLDYGAWLALQGTNPNRRSAHHRAQTQFQGSVRQVRGEIVRMLLARGRVSARTVRTYLGDDPRRKPAIEGLVRDGVVVRRGAYLSLAEER